MTHPFFNPELNPTIKELKMTRGKAVMTLDRRKTSQKIASANHPLIQRMSKTVEEELAAEDAKWRDSDKEIWLSDYSLLNHHVTVKNVLVSMGEEQGLEDEALRVAIALRHDNIKTTEEYQIYRLNRRFTRSERRRMNTHADKQAQIIRKESARVRDEDKPFMRNLYIGVRYHHKPWRVMNGPLRRLTWDMMFADMFCALTEDRENPGMDQVAALKELPRLAKLKMNWVIRTIFAKEIERSLVILNKLYGVDQSIIASR